MISSSGSHSFQELTTPPVRAAVGMSSIGASMGGPRSFSAGFAGAVGGADAGGDWTGDAGFVTGLHELHQDALADQEGGVVGRDHDLDHPFVGAGRRVFGLQLAGAEDGGAAQAGSGSTLVDSEGTHTYSVTQADAAGNESEASAPWVVNVASAPRAVPASLVATSR